MQQQQQQQQQHPAPFAPVRWRRRSWGAAKILLRRRRRLPKMNRPQLPKGGVRSRRGNAQLKKASGIGCEIVAHDDHSREGMEMEVENMKLYLKNRCIMEENQRLRKKALALRNENQILLAELHHRLILHFVKDAHNDSKNNGGADEQLVQQNSTGGSHHRSHPGDPTTN